MSLVGLPNRSEQLVQFSAEAQEIAVRSLVRDVSEGYHPDLEGRPITDLEITFSCAIWHPSQRDVAQYKTLTVTPFDKASTDIETCLGPVHNPIVDSLAAITVSTALSVEDLPAEIWTHSEYYSHMPYGERARTEGLIANSPRQDNFSLIEEARQFIDVLFETVIEPDFVANQVSERRTGVQRTYGLKISKDTVLNGTETPDFIKKYRFEMELQLCETTSRIMDCQREASPGDAKSAIDTYLERAEQLQAAINHADVLLGDTQ